MNIIFKDEMEQAENPTNLWSDEAKTIERGVRVLLGPYGMYKLTGSGSLLGSGKDIMDNIDLGPMAEPIMESVNDQYREHTDGTTSLALLLSRLLIKADELTAEGVKMPNVISGYKKALDIALDELDRNTSPLDSRNPEALEKVIAHAVAGTEADKDNIIKTIRDSILFMDRPDEDSITVKVEEDGEGAEVIKGISLDNARIREDMPDELYDVKLALVDSVAPRKARNDMELKIASVDTYRAATGMEMAQFQRFVDMLDELGVKAVFASGSIDGRAAELMERHGIAGFEKVSEDAMKDLSKSTGAQKSTMDALDEDDLGFAGILDDRRTADGCVGGVCRS